MPTCLPFSTLVGISTVLPSLSLPNSLSASSAAQLAWGGAGAELAGAAAAAVAAGAPSSAMARLLTYFDLAGEADSAARARWGPLVP